MPTSVTPSLFQGGIRFQDGTLQSTASVTSTGTVTSVALTAPASILSVSGSPVTTSGTLSLSLATQTANFVWAGPTSGSPATPSFRALVSTDIPSLAYVTSVAMTVPGIFSVGGSPITSSGTLAVTLATQSANFIWSGPATGSPATPTFRALVAADIPALPYGTGTVTSVAMTVPGILVVGGSPITSSGTLAITLATQTANFVWAGPTTGSPATPTFRALVAADIPTIPASGVSGLAAIATTGKWSDLQNSTASLTLANGANSTEFDQTSNVAWLWKNTTTATVSTINASPTHQLAANYWTGAASAADTWTIGSALAAGTNAISTLTIGHSGSTGSPVLQLPNSSTNYYPNIMGAAAQGNGVCVGQNAGFPLVVSAVGNFDIRTAVSGTIYGLLTTNTTGLIQLSHNLVGGTVSLSDSGGFSRTALYPQIALGTGSSTSFKGTASGTQVAVSIGPQVGGAIWSNGSQNFGGMTFSPASGTTNFVALQISPVVNQTSTASGSYTALKIAVTETALLGSSNKIIACFAGSGGTTDIFSVDNKGNLTTISGVTTVKTGVPGQVATSDLTAQSAAIAATTIYAVPAGGAGLYRVSYVATITTVDSTATVLGGTNGFQVKFTNKSDSVVKTSNPTTPVISSVNATTTVISGDLYANCLASTNLQYLMGYTATGGQMRYDLSIRVEYLG